jgi:uncharacterized damage-inducible protein DinB
MMSSEIRLLLDLIDEAFDRKSWHGTNLRGSIRGLQAGNAAWRPGNGRHNIWEIVVHTAYWKYTVHRRLSGGKRGSFPLTGSDWFERSDPGDRKQWLADIALLTDQHRAMRDTIARLATSDLKKNLRGSSTTAGMLVRGIAAHDLYHAGQIQLLKRLLRQSR